LENARLYESESNSAENAEILRETTNKPTSAVEFDELLRSSEVFEEVGSIYSASIESSASGYCEIVAKRYS
jgi:hypothetical protein